MVDNMSVFILVKFCVSLRVNEVPVFIEIIVGCVVE